MDSTPELWALYNEWKRLTHAEGAAINSADWVEVRKCQNAKKELQPKIIRLTDLVKASCPSPKEQEQIENEIRQHVNDLILLETENNTTLQARLQNLAKERAEMEQTSFRLRKLHKSYAPPSGPAWDRYS